MEEIDEVAVGIKHADRWDGAEGKPFLPPGLTQKVLWRKDRRGIIVFMRQNGYISKAISVRNHAFCHLHWNEMLPSNSPYSRSGTME